MALKSARNLEAPVSDPDRQEAVKITNFVAGRPVREVAAIYALAMQMSLRGLAFEDYSNVIEAISKACLSGWSPEKDATWCPRCHGAGQVYDGELAIGVDPALQRPCPRCKGTGHAEQTIEAYHPPVAKVCVALVLAPILVAIYRRVVTSPCSLFVRGVQVLLSLSVGAPPYVASLP